jgi:hypothetical protein
MKKLKMLLRFTFCLSALVLIASNRSVAQNKTIESKNMDLAQRQLENVRIEEENIGALFSHFSYAYDIPIGLEVARNGDELTSYRIDFKKGTLSDLLNQFVAQHKQYSWKIDNGVLSVFPTYDYRDPLLEELLTTNISSFSVKEKTSTWGFGEALVATPEIKRILEQRRVTCDVGYIGGFYIQQLGQQFSLEVSNVPLKSLLDQVIRESPVAKHWVIANKPSAHKIFLRVKADLEYTPKEAKAP